MILDQQKRDASSISSPLRRLLNYGNSYRQMAGRASLYSILNKFFDVLPEILLGVAIDVIVRQETLASISQRHRGVVEFL